MLIFLVFVFGSRGFCVLRIERRGVIGLGVKDRNLMWGMVGFKC